MHWFPRIGLHGGFYIVIEGMTRTLCQIVVYSFGADHLVPAADIPIALLAVFVAIAVTTWARRRWGTIDEIRDREGSKLLRFVLDLPKGYLWWFVALAALFTAILNLVLIILISLNAIDMACSGAGKGYSYHLPCTFDPLPFKLLLAGLILSAPWARVARNAAQSGSM